MRPALPTILLIVAIVPAARGGDPAAEAALKEKGLVRSGNVFVIEPETQALAKLKEARAASDAHAALVEKRARAGQAVAALAELDNTRAETQAYLDELNGQLKGSGGLPPGMSSRFRRATASGRMDLTAERDATKAGLDAIGRQQKEYRASVLTEKGAKALDAEIVEKWEALKADFVALRPLIDDVRRKYAELEADESVKTALAEANKGVRIRHKLGPSKAFVDGAREFDRSEARVLGKPAAQPKTKARAKK